MSEVTEVVAPERVPASRLSLLARDYGTTLLVAVVVFLVAYDNGSFGEPARDTLAIVLWWALIVGVGAGIWPLVRPTNNAFTTGALLAAFGLVTLFSTIWAANPEGAYAEFTRVALYLAVFAIAVVTGRRRNAGQWSNGLAVGIAAVAALALGSRLFYPHLASQREVVHLLPSIQGRLYYPLGYWNGLAVFAGMGVPLLLRIAVSGRGAFVRGLAVAPLPIIVAVLYLTSSRGGVAATAAGSIAFLTLSARRWAVLGATLVAGIASAAVLWVLSDRHTLVNEPFKSAAETQGKSAALIIGGICVLAALVYGIGSRFVAARMRPPSPAFSWALLAAAVLVAGVGIAFTHPVKRFEAFRQPPGAESGQGTIRQHLLSANGSGRWQLWHSAVDEFQSKPVLGRGAGSYEAWWAKHGTLGAFVQDAHSLYLQVLGELGIAGLVLLAAAFVSGLVAALTRLRRLDTEERIGLAAVTASFVAYALAAGIDWMWELTAVSVVAFACLGLATGPATAVDASARERLPRSRLRFGLRAVFAGAGCVLICAIAVPLLAGLKLRASQDAFGRGDTAGAIADAVDAKSIQPWASSPYLQLALLAEQESDLSAARRWIRTAISHDRSDWRLWLIQSRIQTKLGEKRQALRSFEHARALNPRSRLFQGT